MKLKKKWIKLNKKLNEKTQNYSYSRIIFLKTKSYII